LQSQQMLNQNARSQAVQLHKADPVVIDQPTLRHAARLAERVQLLLKDRDSVERDGPRRPRSTRLQHGKQHPLAPIIESNESQRVTLNPLRDDVVELTEFQPPEAQPDVFQNNDDGDLSKNFDVIEPQARVLTVTVRRSLLLRTRHEIFRTSVVDPSICDLVQFTPREVSIIGRSIGVTNITFWFQDGERAPLIYEVRVVPDPEGRRRVEEDYNLLQQMLAHLFPDSKVYLVPLADKLIVKGQAKDSEEAAQIMQIIRGETGAQTTRGGNLQQGRAAQVLTEEETGGRQSRDFNVVNMLRVPGAQQVALRVKIAELNRSAARGFGVNVDAEINLSDTAAMFIESMLNAASGAGPSLLSQVDGDDITFGLRWLEQEGVARLLSEPTLVTMSGRPATFVAGGEFAVPTIVGAGGISAVTTEFRAFGAIISFLPIVIDKDRIRLEVSPEFSQINTDLNVGDNLGLNVRAVTTTVEMREGQTLAIAGLLDETMTGTKVGELPLLSHILGNRDTSRNETELIILVTPELIHPMEPEEVPPLPGFDITEPNNTEFFLHGHLEGIPTREYRSTLWPRLRRRYQGGGPAMISGPFGHGQ